MILDIAPTKDKALWLSIFYCALSLGYAIGVVFGSAVNLLLGGWYWPFILEGGLMVPMVFLALFHEKDPQFYAKKKGRD
eukprot:CAMPEP_0168314134 /NCGR_PEP_ID=MMETSP0210-20121227/6528_1 /TAXON_ID=40633 /ORGANISM="Condylostoma magnum, Strain COL2" /LENGTH=78 /DNA_ID=CAMNT_0008279169 /DNA_START=360 /DNA_END=596 /DNA_ORIENTATION=-